MERWKPVGLSLALFLLLGAVFTSNLRAGDDELPPYARRTLPATPLSIPPIIDGDISDDAWSEAAVGETFTDRQDGKIVADQTRFWLAYDSGNIYLAAYCYDARPDRLVMLETKRDARLWNDDNLTFEIDPFHTHNWRDSSEFTVNPRGTQASHIGGGRSGKAEWKGDWKAAARVVEDGWTVEMAIPWAILSYPNAKEPVAVGFNVRRNHVRARYQSMFSNIGPNWRNEYTGDWEGVVLPANAFRQEVLILPFLAAGAVEHADVWKRTARGGFDVRYRPTASLTAVVTMNPDFRNVQGEVEGIDFSRGERWVNETRPFFQEGDGMFNAGSSVGRLFYSRRIEKIDLGAKIYGKLAKRTNVGILNAVDFDDQHDDVRSVFRQDTVMSVSQGLNEHNTMSAFGSFRSGRREDNSVASFRFNGRLTERLGGGIQYASSAFHDNDDTDESVPTTRGPRYLRGDLGSVGFDYGGGWFWLGFNAKYLSPGFRDVNGMVEFPGRRGLNFDGEFWHAWREGIVSEAGGDFFIEYQERYDAGNGFEDFNDVVRRAFSTLGKRDSNAVFFRDAVGYFQRTEFRNNFWFVHRGDVGHFREEGAATSDRDWSWGIGFGSRNEARTRDVGIRYTFGRADGTFRHFIAPNAFYRRGDFSTGVSLSVLRHVERLQQHLWSVNFDLTTSMTVGGRLVFRRDERLDDNKWNAFFSFRRSGEAGYETFLIFGDPSADHFIPRLEGKLLFPL